jgi:hypothetical protein
LPGRLRRDGRSTGLTKGMGFVQVVHFIRTTTTMMSRAVLKPADARLPLPGHFLHPPSASLPSGRLCEPGDSLSGRLPPSAMPSKRGSHINRKLILVRHDKEKCGTPASMPIGQALRALQNQLRRRRGVRSSRSCGDTGAPAAARARVIITFCVVPSASARSASQSAKAV